MDKSAKHYSQKVRQHLICPKKDRDRLTARALKELSNFSQENPDAFYEDYVNSFGPPAKFARTLLSELDPEPLLCYRRRRKYFFCAALSVVGGVGLLATILCPVFWHWKYVDSQDLNKNARYFIELKEPISHEDVQKLIDKLVFEDEE